VTIKKTKLQILVEEQRASKLGNYSEAERKALKDCLVAVLDELNLAKPLEFLWTPPAPEGVNPEPQRYRVYPSGGFEHWVKPRNLWVEVKAQRAADLTMCLLETSKGTIH